MDGCTFTPELFTTSNKKNRNLRQFIKDQERYIEYKSIKSAIRKEEVTLKEYESIKSQPEIDDLSKQIVELMDERKGAKSYNRLYQIGKEKLRGLTNEENKVRKTMH
jgi:hypothetical protein